MSDSSLKSIGGLLASVEVQQAKLDELERHYAENKELIMNQLASYVQGLAILSDTQATRAKVVRELYWEKLIPASIINEAFGIKHGGLKKIAGVKEFSFPCDYGCGNDVKQIFHTKYEWQENVRSERRLKTHPSYRYYRVCKDCREREETKKQEEAARKLQAHRQRNEQLRAMDWEDFTETKEWIETRNSLLDNSGSSCEVCHTAAPRIHIYLDKNTPQDKPDSSSNKRYRYFILCSKCVPRCAELINQEKGETIKREFIERIMWQGYTNKFSTD